MALTTFVPAEFNTRLCAIANPEKMAIGTRQETRMG
jgi:hypothetical protein